MKNCGLVVLLFTPMFTSSFEKNYSYSTSNTENKMSLAFIANSTNVELERIPEMHEIVAVTIKGCTFKTSNSDEKNNEILLDLLHQKYSEVQLSCCNQKLSWEEFNKHVKDFHRILLCGKYVIKEAVKCPYCASSHANVSIGRDHIASHIYKSLFRCPFCKEDFSSEAYLKRHFPCNLKKKLKKYTTNQNNLEPSFQEIKNNQLTFVDDKKDTESIKTRLDSLISVITCICNKQNLNSWTLAINHFSRWHSFYRTPRAKNKTFECPHCNTEYKSCTKALECYLRSQNQNIFVCNRCATNMGSREELINHEATCRGNITVLNKPQARMVTGSYFLNYTNKSNQVDEKPRENPFCQKE
ncbi:MAG: hypothetical protein ACOYT8_06815 [Candidatus Dependentiae bacterium]